MSKFFYITTTLPYVNADPHLGHALEFVQADILARYRALCGDEVFFNTGTDEHGIKILRKAQEEGKDPQEYVDGYAARFSAFTKRLNLMPGLHFVRTTDAHHKATAQEFWKRCKAAGDIYQKEYEVKYCVGCELEKTDSELVRGRCSLHPNLDIEIIREENYFFRFSRYEKPLLDLYARYPDLVVPTSRFNEIKAFIGRGLEDFSISRLKSKMPWGVPVPDDESQVMYVWFDALVNYVSTLGWPEDTATFEKFWGTQHHPRAIQVAGKDNLRQQSAMWQAMLMSAGLPPTRQIAIHGFITSGGAKMSKSLGNVIDPNAIIDEYGTDALRFFLAHHVHPFEDSDVTMEKFKEAYNADLANGLGNTAARVMKMAEDNLEKPVDVPSELDEDPSLRNAIAAYDYQLYTSIVYLAIAQLNEMITLSKPFAVIREDRERGVALIQDMVKRLFVIAKRLEPVMPVTAAIILDSIRTNKKPANLFPRKE
jgi:methionyl-tRNA synthetase